MQIIACRNLFYLTKRYGAKMCSIMRLSAIFLFALCVNANAKGVSQNVNLSKTNVRIDEVFRELKKQTAYTFVYKEKILEKANKVSIAVKDASIEKALNICFKDQPLTFSIINKMVVVKEKDIMEG